MQQIANAVYAEAVLWSCFGCPYLRIRDEDDIYEEEFSESVVGRIVFFGECLFGERDKLKMKDEPNCFSGQDK